MKKLGKKQLTLHLLEPMAAFPQSSDPGSCRSRTAEAS